MKVSNINYLNNAEHYNFVLTASSSTNVEIQRDMGTQLLIVGSAFIILEMIICIYLAFLMKRKNHKKRRRSAVSSKPKSEDKVNDKSVKNINHTNKKKKKKNTSKLQNKNIEIKPVPKEFLPKEDNKDYAIEVNDVTMLFKVAQQTSNSLKEYVIKTIKKENKYRHFYALRHVSFKIEKGEVVGIIGTNGSGKSTILKIISGALKPTFGNVKVDRNKVQLLTLGTGFDMELTGKENVYLNGAIIGYTKKYIDEKYDEIVKFAELEGFMDEKVKNYSSGMVSRLGFAIATMRNTPEILILDEVLSVGDMFFRKKSEKRIKEMIHGGSTVLIVSHSMDTIKKNCNKVVWIERGILKMVGEPNEVCDAYINSREAI